MLLLAACSDGGDGAPPAGAGAPAATPTAFRLTVTGTTGKVLDAGGAGQVSFLRKGAKEPVAVGFQNGALAVRDLAPGRYSLVGLGPLNCRGLDFDVGPSGARDLGTLRAEIVSTQYYVALMSGRAATGGELTQLGQATGTPPGAIDARPLGIAESAPCFVSRAGPAATWHELPLGQRLLIGAGIAAFCAIAVASGGGCYF